VRTRLPAVAGSFYADNEGELRTQIHECFLHRLGPGTIPSVPAETDERLLGLVVPHAGYEYSGPVAAHSYLRLALSGPRPSIVILGPNHSGYGSGVSINNTGEWSTPLGEVPVDAEMANQIVKSSGLIDVEDSAHRSEHSIEVQLPFLQFLYPRRFKFVPICMMLQDLETSKDVGEAVAEAVQGNRAIVLASSDWTHYEPQAKAVAKDKLAIQAAVDMDPARFRDTIEEQRVSACGFGPVTALIHAAKILSGNKATVLSYQTSGDVTGDTTAVVGYAALAFTR
jgi:AmmeMemoRadiSam system protein B